MTADLCARLLDLARSGRAAAVATVVRTQGSTPQVVGAKLVAIDDDRGRAAGTLGGGCVEADALLATRDVIRRGGRSLRAYDLSEDLAWNTGLVCGGTMWILAERADDAFGAGQASVLPELEQASNGGPPMAIVTRLHRTGRDLAFAGRIFVDASGARRGSLGGALFDARATEAALAQMPHGTSRLISLGDSEDVLVEPVIGRPQLVVAGGGHVALAIARQARLVDFDVTILEDRPEFAQPQRFEGATVIQGDVPETIGTLHYGWSSFIVIATRGHKLDADCVLAAVKTSARYIGLLGSRRKTILIADMLREHDIADERIRTIHAPVGLDLGGRTPAEIALSVLAEITQERYRGTGQSLSRL